MKRRNFLHTTAALSAATALMPSFLKGKTFFDVIPNEKIAGFEGDSITIIIEMFGGNDGLNTIIPLHDEKRYLELRPNINVPKELAKNFNNLDLFLHPNLVDGVQNGGFIKMLQEGKLAIVEGIGYENPNLSHFRSEELWLSGINTANDKQSFYEGWLGRFIANRLPNYPIEIPEHPIAMQIGGQINLMLKSNKGDMGIALSDPTEFYNLGNGLTPIVPAKTGTTNFDNEFNFVHALGRQSDMYSQAVYNAYNAGKGKLKATYSGGYLSQQLKLIASLIAGGLKTKVYFIKLNTNFDTHVQQTNGDSTTGQHPAMLSNVASGICDFMLDSQLQGWSERVAGFTFSEFGRRAYENGSRGTDHGAGSMLFAFGDSKYLNSGFYGEKPNLADFSVDPKGLDENGNLRYQFQYQRVYVDFLENWFNATSDEIKAVFGTTYLPMGLLKKRTVDVESTETMTNNNFFKLYPNPTSGEFNVSFELTKNSNVFAAIYDVSGSEHNVFLNGNLTGGNYNLPISITTNGNYFVNIVVNGKRYVTKISVVK
jgi:uncharacterized protein (DUF1501 family)